MTVMRTIVLFFAATFVVGCVAPKQVMIHPDTKQVADCSTVGWGYIGAPTALIMHEQCIERYKSMGYVTSEDYKALSTSPRDYTGSVNAGQLIITSSPPGAAVFSGTSAENVKVFIGYTPINLKHPGNGRLWDAECYRAKLNNNAESNVICRHREVGDRLVHFDFSE